MAEAMTYDSLVDDLQSYAERSDDNFISRIPRFIMMAENKLASKVKGLGQLRLVSGNFNAGNNILQKPDRWRETASWWYTDSTGVAKYLKNRAYEYCRLYAAGAAAGDPEFYSDYGYEHFFLASAPAAASPFELTYFERPEPLSSSNQSNWITQYAPQLILFATLKEAQVWLKLKDRADEFEQYYNDAATAVTQESVRRVSDFNASRKPA